MKLKKILAIGISVAMIANTMPANVYADTETANTQKVSGMCSIDSNQTDDKQTNPDDREFDIILWSKPIEGAVYRLYTSEDKSEEAGLVSIKDVDNKIITVKLNEAPTRDTRYFLSATEEGKLESRLTSFTIKAYHIASGMKFTYGENTDSNITYYEFYQDENEYNIILPTGTASDAPVSLDITTDNGATVEYDGDTKLKDGKGTVSATVTAAEGIDLSYTYTVNFDTMHLEGEGTEENPYLISSEEELVQLADCLNSSGAAPVEVDNTKKAGNYYGYNFKLTKDLDMTGIKYEPIGHSGDNYFAGNFDGDGHTISNVKCEGKLNRDSETKIDCMNYSTGGIFGWTAYGVIENLTVRNADISATGYGNRSYAGGIMAVAYACTVSDCAVYDSNIESNRTPNNSNFAGGISGIALEADFNKCASVRNVIKHTSYGGGMVGALDGSDDTTFSDCNVSECTIIGGNTNCGLNTENGAFLGATQDIGIAVLKNCYVYGCTPKVSEDNTTSNNSIGLFSSVKDKINATDSYYYDESGVDVNADNVVAKIKNSFADGEVAYILQGEQTENIWGQNIGKDAYPVLNGPKVYQVDKYDGCKNAPGENVVKAYSNTNETIYADHSDENNDGICDMCNEGYEPPKLTSDKYDLNGDGTADEVYEISSVTDLYWYAGLINGTLEGVERNSSANAVLTTDITVNENVTSNGELADDISGFKLWTPIGGVQYSFEGIFDGQNHTISGLYVDENATSIVAGFFGKSENLIKNLKLNDCYFQGDKNTDGNGNNFVGAICGYNCGGDIVNCSSDSVVKGENLVGGITGGNYYGIVSECFNMGTVTGLRSGGIAAWNTWEILNCYNMGTVTGTGSEYTGGICGYNMYSLINCYSMGTVNGSERGSINGGLCGTERDGKAINCYYLEGCNGEGTTFKYDIATAKTLDAFVSGEVAYLLFHGETDFEGKLENGSIWGQTLTGEGRQEYPVLGGPEVYRSTKCEAVLSNTYVGVKEHAFGEDDICKDCHKHECTITNKDYPETYVVVLTDGKIKAPLQENFNVNSDAPLTFEWYTGDYTDGSELKEKIEDEPVQNRINVYTLVVTAPETVKDGIPYLSCELRVRVEIEKAIPEYTVPTNITANCGDYLQAVQLPEGFSWDEDEQILTVEEDADEKIVTKNAKYAVGLENKYYYKEVTGIKINIRVTHIFNNYNWDFDETCTGNEHKTSKCAGCNRKDTIEVPDSALGHIYVPEFEWSEDYSTCSSILTCVRDGCTEDVEDHTVVPACTVTRRVENNPTCTSKGKSRYTATCIYDGQTYSDYVYADDIEMVNHNLTKIEAKEATCNEKGYREHWICSCGQYFLSDDANPYTAKAVPKESIETPIAPSNHEGGVVIRNIKEATCAENGYTGDWCCTDCNEILEKGTVTDKLTNHTYVNGLCSVCGKVFEGLGDGLYYKAVTETDKDGKTSVKLINVPGSDVPLVALEVTGSYYSDNGKVTIQDEVTLDQAEGTFKIIKIAENAFSNTDVNEIIVPDNVIEVGKGAFGNIKTITFTGKTAPAGLKEALSENVNVNVPEGAADDFREALPEGTEIVEVHTVHVKDAGTRVEPTCEKSGSITYKCSVCGEVIEVVKLASLGGHSWDAGQVTKEPTETEEGIKTYTCVKCGETRNESLPKKETPAPKPPKKGAVIKDDKKTGNYKVMDVKKKQVSFKAPVSKNSKTVKIPSTIKISGVSYKVVSIYASAFKNNKKVTKITIGSNVTSIYSNAFKGCTALKTITLTSKINKIESNAFYGCKKLKTITIKSTKLSSKTVSKNAFKGISKTTTIKVPKKKYSAYKKLLKSRGLSSKVKIKAY